MSCKKCGGNRPSMTMDVPAFSVESLGEPSVTIGAKASILLDGIDSQQVFLRVGKTMKISNAAAADLQQQGAPIWIL